jgi:proteasome lid subunit RPN8/RPN11
VLLYPLELTQAVLNSTNILAEIEEHFTVEYPREGCGVLAVSKGKMKWLPITNKAGAAEDFIFDSTEYFKIKRTHDIVGIVHSHPDASCEPSVMDINNCNSLGIPYYIFSYPEMDMHLLQPVKNYYPLIGREYKFGVQDCFEAMRDYYIEETDFIIPPREPFEDDWWLKGLDYFTEEYINRWGFNKVLQPQKNDLLIFSVGADVGNHCGVYLGNDVFFHHATQRLSCRENLYPFWVKHLTGIYRL